MLTESNQEAIRMGEGKQINVVASELEHDEWYYDIVYYLNKLTCPYHLVDYKRRVLRLNTMRYFLTEEGLGWKNPDQVLLRCVNQEEAEKLLKELHSKYCGGNFVARTTAHKILRARYYWPTLFFGTHRHL
jgi:hypothetical protein